jgi:hypothetical protein
VTERELQASTIELARLLGFRVAHFGVGLVRGQWRTPAQADAVGFPDLCIVGHGRVLFRELKCGRNRLTVEQGEWLEALEAAGCDVGIWREFDWHAGVIEAELRGEAAA